MLLQLPDSASGGGGVTDKKGKFSFEKIPPGNYVLRCSFIGFDAIETSAFTLSANNAVYNVGAIELSAAGGNLSDVIVTGKRSTLNTSIDRKV